ncbi:hypothetical protein HDU67_002915 [Dinochytrium kinnereticum]|nr:hypothetical protein HDU67_002915 [Dinochytrium kinnereticum]
MRRNVSRQLEIVQAMQEENQKLENLVKVESVRRMRGCASDRLWGQIAYSVTALAPNSGSLQRDLANGETLRRVESRQRMPDAPDLVFDVVSVNVAAEEGYGERIEGLKGVDGKDGCDRVQGQSVSSGFCEVPLLATVGTKAHTVRKFESRRRSESTMSTSSAFQKEPEAMKTKDHIEQLETMGMAGGDGGTGGRRIDSQNASIAEFEGSLVANTDTLQKTISKSKTVRSRKNDTPLAISDTSSSIFPKHHEKKVMIDDSEEREKVGKRNTICADPAASHSKPSLEFPITTKKITPVLSSPYKYTRRMSQGFVQLGEQRFDQFGGKLEVDQKDSTSFKGFHPLSTFAVLWDFIISCE